MKPILFLLILLNMPAFMCSQGTRLSPSSKGILQEDTTNIPDTSIAARINETRPTAARQYAAYRHSLNIQFIPGINSGGGYFEGRILFSYCTPKIRFGLGSGYVAYRVNFDRDEYILIALSSLHVDELKVSFAPLFGNFTLNLSRRRVVPYISFDIGLSIPLVTDYRANATYYSNVFGYESDTKGVFEIDDISTGFYFGFLTGVRYNFNRVVEAGISFGFDFCANSYSGLYKSTDPETPQTAEYHSTRFSGGFIANLTFGISIPITSK